VQLLTHFQTVKIIIEENICLEAINQDNDVWEIIMENGKKIETK
jgi:hypothetical protein